MTQSSQYRFPAVDYRWADVRNTDLAVAKAIHAISDSKRSPEDIWADPTPAELDHVKMAVEEYLRCDLIKASPDNQYQWGVEAFNI